jgi:peptide deformylase
MAILQVTQYGDEILVKKAESVKKIDRATLELINNMFDTMHNADGIGLAANQVGSNKAIFVIDLSEVKGYEKSPKLIFINPRVAERSSETIKMEEGCLSLPGLHVEVERPKSIKMIYHDLELREQTIEADGMAARVMQHEFDHLLGYFATDRVEEDKKKELKSALAQIKNREVEVDYPVTVKPAKK